MARPKSTELTERELEIMQVFWQQRETTLTIAEVQQKLNDEERELAYTTVATLVRILVDKGFLEQTTDRRPHEFSPTRTHEEVSGRLLKDLVQRVFGGSSEALLQRLMEDQELTASERKRLEALVQKSAKSNPKR
ncbi:BlaI/MecI/CopY family transcriptional regulator [Aureliella helgolandensis]|uniref:Transcriptional regulator BlaI n=1 Tax=Aureliella helgolandensis TaxID=2527968 RepID=A0A518GDY3_9BACT|nr:BlaI/MecI/CopY family transcriptional regulator [Aureliella helgolandensis]QDV26770.1 Transcriptional regulator BlaI [Aureliella helgolandensis]